MSASFIWYVGELVGSMLTIMVLRALESESLWRHIPHHCNGYVAMAGNVWPCRKCGRPPVGYAPPSPRGFATGAD